MRRSLLWRLPVLIGMVLIGGPSVLIYGNAVHRWIAGVPMYRNTMLHGVVTPVGETVLTRETVLSGEFGREYTTYFGRNFPLLTAAVHAKGQLYWSILHQSPVSDITIGRNETLYENVYLNDYCSRDIHAFEPIAEAWAAKLIRVQRWYAAQGKVFLYLLTPSKAAAEPENIPTDWPCAALPADRENFHNVYRGILDRAGINVVDTVETTLAAKMHYNFPPFPPGGAHFNILATALAVQKLIAVLNQASTWRRMDEFKFTWKLGDPRDVDTDLLETLNVPDTGPPYQTPSITISPSKAEHCIPVSMGQVGGSFTYQVDKVLQRTACPPNIDLYEYYHAMMAFYPGDNRYPVDPKRRTWFLLHAADVVVLEENEELAARSQHGEAFYELVAAQFPP